MRRFVHVSSNSPFGANRRRPIGSPRTPRTTRISVTGSQSSKRSCWSARATTRRRSAVMVRGPWFYGPHQPERQGQFFAPVRRGRFPIVGRARTALDGLHREPGRRPPAGGQRGRGAPGRAYWIADAEPYELRQIVPRCGRALEAEGLPVSGRPPTLPAFVGRIAARTEPCCKRAACTSKHCMSSAKQGHDRLRHLPGPRRGSAMTRHSLLDGCGPASGSASTAATRCDGPGGRRLLITGGSGYFGTVLATQADREEIRSASST